MSLTQSYFRRKAEARRNVGKFLHEKADAESSRQEALKEEQVANTFRATRNRTRENKLETGRLDRAIRECFVRTCLLGIIRETQEGEFEGIDDAELMEQVNLVRQDFPALFNEGSSIPSLPSSLNSMKTPIGFKLHESGDVNAYLSGPKVAIDDSAAALRDTTLRTVVIGTELKKASRTDADLNPVSFDVNTIEISAEYGDEYRNFFDSIVKLNAVTNRSKIVSLVKAEGQSRTQISEESDVTLSEAGKLLQTRKVTKMAIRGSLLESVFTTVKLLRETVGASNKDYMNETVFVLNVLKAHESMGLTEAVNTDKVLGQLARVRSDFLANR